MYAEVTILVTAEVISLIPAEKSRNWIIVW